uniref:Uncharacterized protein n=1 Tax=Moorena producens (strain JHB) TaxID=1454205 RepID=A0A1D9G1A6_MOOP1
MRQKKTTCIQDDEQVYRALKDLGIKPGMKEFYQNILCSKNHKLGKLNLAAYWKRKYRGKGSRQPWYILTSLTKIKMVLSLS